MCHGRCAWQCQNSQDPQPGLLKTLACLPDHRDLSFEDYCSLDDDAYLGGVRVVLPGGATIRRILSQASGGHIHPDLVTRTFAMRIVGVKASFVGIPSHTAVHCCTSLQQHLDMAALELWQSAC